MPLVTRISSNLPCQSFAVPSGRLPMRNGSEELNRAPVIVTLPSITPSM